MLWFKRSWLYSYLLLTAIVDLEITLTAFSFLLRKALGISCFSRLSLPKVLNGVWIFQLLSAFVISSFSCNASELFYVSFLVILQWRECILEDFLICFIFYFEVVILNFLLSCPGINYHLSALCISISPSGETSFFPTDPDPIIIIG